MRRTESKFASEEARGQAVKLGEAVRLARLARNATLEAIAARARMSPVTWMRIEKGEVSVSMGAWLSALEQAGLLHQLANAITPPAIAAAPRQRARRAKPEDFDF